jgi:hypothetical protein
VTSNPLFDNAPYLTPWYVNEHNPTLIKDGKVLHWKFFEKIRGEYVGLFTLRNYNNALFGAVKGYNYIHPSSDNSMFMIWSRNIKSDPLNPCITIDLYDVNKLTPIITNRKKLLDFSKSKKPYFFSDKPIASMQYFIDTSIFETAFAFPEEFKIFNSFMAVIDYDGLYDDNKEFGNTLMLEFNPKLDTIKHFPQDWFNKSNADFGYVWITRAIRDNNRLINGQGFRMSDFILDETGRELRK